jgi:hypothetical protein
MKRWILLAVLVVVITTTATIAVQYLPIDSGPQGGVLYPAAKNDSGPKPLAVVDDDLTHHFGMAAQKVVIDKNWEIKNEGKGDLVLTKGVIECNCTVAAFDGDKNKDSITLKPGQKTTLHTTFETRIVNGPFLKKAEILTNDPLHPSLTFAAEGTVRPSVVLYPPEPTINFLEISNDQDDHHSRMLLFSPDQPDIQITSLTTSRPGQVIATEEPMTAEDCKAMQVEKGRRITIDVKGNMPLGPFREELVIRTNHPKQPELKVTVAGNMVGPITASPERVLMRLVHSPIGGSGAVTLTVRGLRPTRFEVEKKPEKLDVAVTPSEMSPGGGQYLLTVKVPPGMAAGDVDDLIVLRTDHPKAGEVKIPVAIRVQND